MIYLQNVIGVQEISIPRAFGVVVPVRPDYVEEAPLDGNQYARKNGGWAVVQGGGGTPVDAYTKSETDALLAGKADDSAVVHKSGAETIADTKTFAENPILEKGLYLVSSGVAGVQLRGVASADGTHNVLLVRNSSTKGQIKVERDPVEEYELATKQYTDNHHDSTKADATELGSLASLTTTDKTSVVAAINELKATFDGLVIIDNEDI